MGAAAVSYLTGIFSKVIMQKVCAVEPDLCGGLMGGSTRASSLMIKLKAKAYTESLRESLLMANLIMA